MNEQLKTMMSIQTRQNSSTSYSDMTARPAQLLCVALIDDLKLSRECFVSAAFITQPLLAITPFSSIDEFLQSRNNAIDLIIYVYHDHGTNELEELLLTLRHFPAQSLVIISDSVSGEALPVLREFEARSATVIHAQDTALQTVVSSLYIIRHGRRNGTVPMQQWPATAPSPMPAPRAEDDLPDLTKRERTVLELVRQGRANKEIALALHMSISTVKAHVRNIMQKTGSSNRIQLALGVHRPRSLAPRRDL